MASSLRSPLSGGALEAQLAEHEARRLDGEVRRLELRDAAAQVAAMATALEAAPFEERQQLVRLIVPRRPGFGVTIHASGRHRNRWDSRRKGAIGTVVEPITSKWMSVRIRKTTAPTT
jgi:hypothetical protein